MTRWRPDVREERRFVLSRRVDDWIETGLTGNEKRESIDTALESGWHGWSGWVRIALFVFSIVGVFALGLFLHAIKLPGSAFVAGVLSIVLAEVMIAGKRWFRAGVEEALWIAGLFAMVLEIEPSNFKVWLVWLAIIALVAAIRLLNALFAVLSGVFLVFRFVEWQDHAMAAMVALFAGLFAALLLVVRWRRPFHEDTLSWFVIVSPLLGYALFRAEVWTTEPSLRGIVLIGGTGAMLCAIGIARRVRAPLISAMLLLAATAYELSREVQGLSNDVKLIIGGAFLLALALFADRSLRTSRSGWTSRKIDEQEGFSLLEIASSVSLAPSESAPQNATHQSGGGKFGGGGGSGEF